MRAAAALALATLGAAAGLALLAPGGAPDRGAGAVPHVRPRPAGRPADRLGAMPVPPRGWSVVAVVRAGAVARRAPRPGAPVVARLAPRTPEGAPRALLVRGRRRSWARVLLPRRPNGVTGWIALDGVAQTATPWRIDVRRHRHRLVLRRAGRPVLRARIAVGTAQNPTPRGIFFVTGLLRQPDPRGFYGPWVLVLSGFAPRLERFAGGHGELGIHGTDAPGRLGGNVSHGCVRVADGVVRALAARVTLGTPVVVR